MALCQHTPSRPSNRATLAEVGNGTMPRCFHGGSSRPGAVVIVRKRCCTARQLVMAKGCETQRNGIVTYTAVKAENFTMFSVRLAAFPNAARGLASGLWEKHCELFTGLASRLAAILDAGSRLSELTERAMHRPTALNNRSGCSVCLVNESIRLLPRLKLATRSNALGHWPGIASLAGLIVITTLLLL
jgi:hypothetical protein